MLDEPATFARKLILIGALVYLSAFLFGVLTLLFQKQYQKTTMYTLLFGGFIFQLLGLNLRGIEVKGCPIGNIFEISQFITWSLVLLYLVVGPIFKLRLLDLFTAALASLFSITTLLVPRWDQAYSIKSPDSNPLIELHAALAIFSYAIFAIVALVSVMFLIQQHGLKKKQCKGLYPYLPSVQKLDLIAKRLLITGVFVLSAALVFGVLFWASYPERVPTFKLLTTLLLWFGYLTVVVLRLRKHLVTRRHAIAVICLFLFALISLWPVQSARGRHADTYENTAATEETTDNSTAK